MEQLSGSSERSKKLWRLDEMMEDPSNIASPASCWHTGPQFMLLPTRLHVLYSWEGNYGPGWFTQTWFEPDSDKQTSRTEDANMINMSTREHSRLIKQCWSRILQSIPWLQSHPQTTWSTILPHQARWWSYLETSRDHLKDLPSPPPVTDVLMMTTSQKHDSFHKPMKLNRHLLTCHQHLWTLLVILVETEDLPIDFVILTCILNEEERRCGVFEVPSCLDCLTWSTHMTCKPLTCHCHDSV